MDKYLPDITNTELYIGSKMIPANEYTLHVSPKYEPLFYGKSHYTRSDIMYICDVCRMPSYYKGITARERYGLPDKYGVESDGRRCMNCCRSTAWGGREVKLFSVRAMAYLLHASVLFPPEALDEGIKVAENVIPAVIVIYCDDSRWRAPSIAHGYEISHYFGYEEKSITVEISGNAHVEIGDLEVNDCVLEKGW